MEATSQRISLRSAEPADCDLAIDLIMLAAENMLCTIFGDGDEQLTRGFLRTAWHLQHSQFGYGQHNIACLNHQPVGICTFWHSAMPEVFAKDTACAILNYYDLDTAKQVVGRSHAATYSIPKPQFDELIIGHVAVLPDYQRVGIGQAIIHHGIQQAIAINKTRLGLDVDKHNQGAIAFYRAMGFMASGKQDDDMPFLHMQKAIKLK